MELNKVTTELKNEATTDDLIEMLQSNERLPLDQKLKIFFEMSCPEKLLTELSLHGTMVKQKMIKTKPMYVFAYGVIKLIKPELFEDENSTEETS